MSEEEINEAPVEETENQEESHETKSNKPSRPKVSRMDMAQVDTALKKVEESMGGFESVHARALLARKAQLENTQPLEQRKAA